MKPKAKQFPFVESPATVSLVPVHLGAGVGWHSFDQILVAGLQLRADEPGQHRLVGYLPRPIPRSWAGHEIWGMVEFVCAGLVDFTLHYACNSSGRTFVESGEIIGNGQPQRVVLDLDEVYISHNQLFCSTLDIGLLKGNPVLLLGAWLEVGIEAK